MLNPQAIPFLVDGKEYGVVWQDFSTFRRMTVYRNDKRIGWRNLPIDVDKSDGTVQYLIRYFNQLNRGGLI